jgi:hypothetical protein
LLKQPGFSLIAIVTLEIGIGANMTMFTGAKSLFYRLLGLGNPEEIV